MVNVVVVGAAGRMGARLVALVHAAAGTRLVGATEGKGHPSLGRDAGEQAGCGRVDVLIEDDLSAVLDRCDVVIDFSAPASTLANLKAIVSRRRAAVVGTTGFLPAELAQFHELARQVPCVFSPNMSVGVNVLFKVLGEVAHALGDEYDIEVVEAHHRLKKDAPSGTALKIADVLAAAMKRDLAEVAVYARKGMIGERTRTEIGIQTIRAGDIVGDHTVLFGGPGERVEITHRAHSRDAFAGGAVRAAQWVVGQAPGIYDMQDVLGLG
ncbi:4-hydroxy-tetrahydrodipicolinate reductase [Nitrospira sp.]|nr:4-hydroxy-tetrahydrodipicolinate reductase [Nitrospira sp.]